MIGHVMTKKLRRFRQALASASVEMEPMHLRTVESIVSSIYFREGYPVVSKASDPGRIFAVTHYREYERDGGSQGEPVPARVGLAELSGPDDAVSMGEDRWIWLHDSVPESAELMKEEWTFEGWLNCGFRLDYFIDEPNVKEARSVLIVQESPTSFAFVNDYGGRRSTVCWARKEYFNDTGRRFVQAKRD